MGVGTVLKYVTWPVWKPVHLILQATGAAIWFPMGIVTTLGAGALTQCDLTNDAPNAIEQAIKRYGSQECNAIKGRNYCRRRVEIMEELDQDMRQIEGRKLYFFDGGREFDPTLSGRAYRATIGAVEEGIDNASGGIGYVSDFFRGDGKVKKEVKDVSEKVRDEYDKLQEKLKAIEDIKRSMKTIEN